MKRNFEKGITLVSLVVTIIVLIILAAVSINVIIGQDGIITKAKQAAQNMEIATLQEQERLNELYAQMSGETTEGGVAYDKIAELNQKYATLKEQYDALNTEYSNFKTTIATAITDKGVATLATDSAGTMASNIRSIAKQSTNFFEYYYYKKNWTPKSTLTVECGFEPSLVMCMECYYDQYGNHCYVQIYDFENDSMRGVADGEIINYSGWTFERTKTSASITNGFAATVTNINIWVM